MVLYITICLISIFFAYAAGLQNGRWNKSVYISFFLLWLLLGFQNDCGIDIPNYREWFDTWSQNYTPRIKGVRLVDTKTEVGWFLLNKAFSYIGGYRFFQMMLMAFFVMVLAWLVRKNVMPHYYWFAIIVFILCPYYLLFFSSQIRQATCVVINIIVFFLLFCGMRWKYKWLLIVLLTTISISFHQSSLIALPVFLIVYCFNRPTNYPLLIIVFLILYVVFALMPIEQIIDYISLWVGSSGIERYEHKIVGSSVYSLLHNGFYFLVLFLILDTMRYYDKEYSRLNAEIECEATGVGVTKYGGYIIDPAFRAMFLLVAFSTLMEVVFRFGGAAHRIVHYFDIFGLVVYPIVIQRYKETSLMLSVGVAALLLYRFITSFWGFMYNYQGEDYWNFMISFD